MVTYLEWPRGLVNPRHWNRGFDPQSSADNRLALSGRLNNGGPATRGIWRPQFADVPVNEAKNLVAWQGLEMQLSGRDYPVLVPYYPRGNYPKAGEPSTGGFSDGSTFADGSGFVTTGTTVLAASVALAGTVFLTVDKVQCGTIRPGHAFSINGHLYAVRFVEEQTDDRAVLEIAPELREAVLPRDEVEFTYPVVKCRLADTRAFSGQLQYGRYGYFTVQFIEDTSPDSA